jgi:DNA-binding NtrC family response regulator
MVPRKRQHDVAFEPIMRSAAMRKAVQIIGLVAAKEVILTLIGESGTGKEVLARRAHELSERRKGPFVPINCAAIPDSLFESELFGHERGAFTGASERARGKVDAAENGTLFLDEIGEMPIPMQAKLLRFLENRRYMRVGGATKIEADVRLMFATARSLEQEVKAGRFRGDLFYRIQGITVNVPPLRERRADIAPLLSQFVVQISSRHGVRPARFSRQARAFLLGYDWPGNVRELKNVVETVTLLRAGRQVRSVDLPESIRTQRTAAPLLQELGGGASPATVTFDLNDGLEALIRQIVERALVLDQGSSIRTAARLRISTRTVQRYLASGRVRASPPTPKAGEPDGPR